MQTTELNPYDDISYTQMSVTNVARIVYSARNSGRFLCLSDYSQYSMVWEDSSCMKRMAAGSFKGHCLAVMDEVQAKEATPGPRRPCRRANRAGRLSRWRASSASCVAGQNLDECLRPNPSGGCTRVLVPNAFSHSVAGGPIHSSLNSSPIRSAGCPWPNSRRYSRGQ